MDYAIIEFENGYKINVFRSNNKYDAGIISPDEKYNYKKFISSLNKDKITEVMIQCQNVGQQETDLFLRTITDIDPYGEEIWF